MLERLTEWGERQANTRAIVLTGSRTHAGARVDRLSDYDLEIFVADITTFA